MNQYEEGETVRVVDNRTGETEIWEVVKQIDTYIYGAHYYPEVYLLKQIVMHAYGNPQLHTDVVNAVKMRKIR